MFVDVLAKGQELVLLGYQQEHGVREESWMNGSVSCAGSRSPAYHEITGSGGNSYQDSRSHDRVYFSVLQTDR